MKQLISIKTVFKSYLIYFGLDSLSVIEKECAAAESRPVHRQLIEVYETDKKVFYPCCLNCMTN